MISALLKGSIVCTIHHLLFVISSEALAQESTNSKWLGTVAIEHRNEDREKSITVWKPQLNYSHSGTGYSLEYSYYGANSPDTNEKLELGIALQLKNSRKSSLSVENEISYTFNEKRAKAIFIVVLDFEVSKSYTLSFESKNEYYQSNRLSLHKSEFKPLLEYAYRKNNHNTALNLALPMRIFDKDNTKSPTLTATEIGVSYTYKLTSNTAIKTAFDTHFLTGDSTVKKLKVKYQQRF